MGYMKYILSKTGRFPQWKPRVEDVLDAATRAHEVKNIVTPSRNWYYYVIPASYNVRYLYDLVRVFSANGIILRPHKTHNYGSIIFRVPNRGQKFMRDVTRVSQDVDNFKRVLAERNIDMSPSDFARLLTKMRSRDR